VSWSALRDFATMQSDEGLETFTESDAGTLYFVPPARGTALRLVRRFDGALPSRLVEAYAGLVRACQDWIERDRELAGLVRVDQPVEVGRDFVARPHRLYHVSLRTYARGTVDEPPELARLRQRFAQLAARAAGADDEIVVATLGPSILDATAKTFWEPDEERFVVVEPKVTRELLERWAQRG
jgi:hypothetical protein